MVGLVGVCQFLPMLLFSLFAGVIVDRFSKKKLLIFTQILFMLQAIAMTLLTLTGLIQYWHILILSFIFGLTQTLDMPARQSFFIDLVGIKDLTNAISLNSTIVNLARIAGPAVSGILMVKLGTVFCFSINAISYIPVIIGIMLIKVADDRVRKSHVNILPEVIDGIRYIKNNQTLVVNVFIMAAVCTFAMNNDVIIPVFAKVVLGSGANGYSFLLSMAGLGAFLAAITMAYLSKNGVKKILLLFSGILTAVLQISTFLTQQYVLCAVLITCIGFFNLIFINTANSIFQLSTPNEYRGRVMSVYSFLNMGSTPIGNFLAGSVMETVGGDSGFLFCGATTLVHLAVIFTIKRKEIGVWIKTRS
jgi:MFS family permease